MNSIEISIYVLGGLILLALLFDFMNGFHDAANAIATVVSTGVLKPQTAVAMAAFFNFVAIFVVGLGVAKAIGKGIIEPGVVDQYVIFGALVGAILWNVITWYYGIPSSSSHALIGGLVGSAVAKAGTGALIAGGLYKTIIFIVLAPFLGFALGALIMLIVSWLFVRSTPRKVDTWFRRLQLVSAAEDARHYLDAPDRDRQPVAGCRFPAAVGHHRLLRDHQPGYLVRRLAHRKNHGPEDHQAQTGGRLLR
jgi:PiT family inorganic phosphate transporter